MSKKNPAKERAREKRKKQARLRSEEHKKKQLKQEAAVWAFLNGEATAKAIALFLNGTTRPPAATEESKLLGEQLNEVKGPISDFVASIIDATDDQRRFANPVPSLLFLASDESSDGIQLAPQSIVDEFDGVEGLSYRPIDRAFAEEPDLLVAAWLVGVASPNTPDTCFALCGNSGGARACFVVTGEEWSPIHDRKALTPILQMTVDFLIRNDHPEVLLSQTVDRIMANVGPSSDVTRDEVLDLLRETHGSWASEVVSLARLRMEDVRVRDEELDFLSDEQDGLRAELVESEKALRRTQEDKRVLEQRLARAESRADLNSNAALQPSGASKDHRDPQVEPLATRLRAIF